MFHYRSPVVDLVEQKGIDTLLLPLSWWDMFPHQLAHSNEDAWARGLQVLSKLLSLIIFSSDLGAQEVTLSVCVCVCPSLL